MKKSVFAFAAAIAIISFAAVSPAGAMNIGSLSRQHPVVPAAELAALADPAVCLDLSCGVAGKSAADYSPVLHIVFASVGGFLSAQVDHVARVMQTGRRAGIQLVASAN